METGWILLPDTSPTLETFRKRPRRVPMVFPSPTSTRDGYGHINGVPVLHRCYIILYKYIKTFVILYFLLYLCSCAYV
ncbi:hypothetical protein Hanom_Chr08g00704051 [Helianthus anomalus]